MSTFKRIYVDVLISIKQIKNVKSLSLVNFFGDIVCYIHCGNFFLTVVHMLQHIIAHFLYEKFVEQRIFEECLHLQHTKLVQLVVRYIQDDTTHYRGSSPTIYDQGGLLPEISIPILVGILDKSLVQLSLKEYVYLEYLIIPTNSSWIA